MTIFCVRAQLGGAHVIIKKPARARSKILVLAWSRARTRARDDLSTDSPAAAAACRGDLCMDGARARTRDRVALSLVIDVAEGAHGVTDGVGVCVCMLGVS